MSDGTKVAAGPSGLLSGACVLGLIGVVFSALHFLWPTPLSFSLFMILGQGAFGLAMGLYGIVIIRDLRTRKVL